MPADIMDTKVITFPLPPNSKKPRITNWQNLKRSIPTKNRNQNKAFLTGRTTGIFVLDLDLYKPFKGISIDSKYKEEHPFYRTIISEDYLKYLTNYTQSVKTPSGGYHLYFLYNKNFPNCSQNDEYNYDIRSNGGYVVYPNSKIDNKYYQWINRGEIKPIPEELEKFLIDTYKITKEIQYEINDDEFKYVLDVKTFKFIVDKIPLNYLESYNKWLVITTLIRKIYDKVEFKKDVLKIWDDWCQINPNNYHYQENLKYFNSVNPKNFDISQLFNITKIQPFGFVKLVDEFKEPDNKINVSLNKLGYEFITEKKNKFYITSETEKILLPHNKILIKSDTGTGKTTAFNHFIKKSKNKFISLVSRQLLGLEQHINLKSLGITSQFYLTDEYNYGDNIIICADSLITLDGFDFSEYVCFIDEFNSVVEYIETSTTHLKNLRKPLIKLIIKMIKECKFFIGVDADISEVSYDFMVEATSGDFTFIKNDYQHFKNVEYVIYHSELIFLENLKKEEKFLLCSDSATFIENINVDLSFVKIIGKNKTGEISDEDQEIECKRKKINFIHLDSSDRIGFSPKIVYGQDSVMKRPVYAWFRGHTISPPQMVQQIARCRNPTKVHIYFKDERSYYPIYNNIKETEDDILNTFNIYKCEYKTTDELMDDIFYRLLQKILYRNDSYKTSKYLHLINILNSRGFKLLGFVGKRENVKFSEEKEKVKEEYEKNFLKHLKMDKLPDYISKVNKILNIPEDKLKDYSKIFIDDYLLKEHFTVCKILLKDTDKLEKKLLKMDEFLYNKMKSENSKIKLLFKFMNILKLDVDNVYKNDFSDIGTYNPAELEKEYKAVVRTNVKNLEFKEPYNLYVKFGLLFRSLTSCIISSKEKHKVILKLDEDKIKFHKDLMNYRLQSVSNNDFDFID